MRLRYFIAFLLGLSVLSAVASVGFGQASNPGLSTASQRPTVSRASAVIFKSLDMSEGFRVECLRKIDVAAQADGLIQQMEVEEGSTVPQGGVLFRIDNRVAEAQLQVAKKKLESAQKQAEQTAEIKFAEASYKVAQAEYDAEKQLLAKNVTTLTLARRKELEANKAFLSIEAATVKNQTDKLAVGVAEAEFNAAQVQLGLYDIVAPWDAYVNQRMKDQGAWIRAGEPVLKIHHMAEMKVVGFIKIKEVSDRGWSINNLEGAKIRVSVSITPTQKHMVDSVINFVSSEIDDSNNVRVSARIRNERIGNSWLLRDGVPAEVSISIE